MYFLVTARATIQHYGNYDDEKYDDTALVVADTEDEAEQKYRDHIGGKTEMYSVYYTFRNIEVKSPIL